MIRALALALLVGCWTGTTPPPAPPQNDAPVAAKPPPPRRPMTEIQAVIAKMRGLTAQMCACKDKACADDVQDELTSWSQTIARNGRDADVRPSDDDMRQMQEVGTHYAECMMKAMDPTAGP